MSLSKSLAAPILAVVATLALAAPAQGAPSLKDARQANAKAKRALAGSVAAARAGLPDAARKVARARKLQARASRISRRAATDRPPVAQARVLRRTAAGVDGAFDAYAELLPQVPAELQPALAEALARLSELRAGLVAEITGFVDELPADVREQVLAAIAAFQADGDLEALIAALTDPAVSSAVQAQLEELVAGLTVMLEEQIRSLGGLAELLPPGALGSLEGAMAQLQTQLETALGRLGEILGPGGELPEVPAGVCGELEALLAELGFPLPPGFCEPA